MVCRSGKHSGEAVISVQHILDQKGDRVVSVSRDTVLSEISRILASERMGTVLVTDEHGLAGIISERDIIRAMSEHGAAAIELPAARIMSEGVITCTGEDSLAEILAQMSSHTIRHMPVLSNKQVVGLVSIRDILNFQQQMFVADIERRKQDSKALEEAFSNLEAAFEARTEEYRLARDAALDANRAKSEFLATMNHELRTPLNAIIGFSDVMRTEALGPIGSPRYQEYVSDINESGCLLLSLINDLLDMSKIESGKEELLEEAVGLQSAADIALKLVSDRVAKKNILVEMDIDAQIPLLWADERKIKQILTNLLSNAVKFTPDEGTVTVKAWCRPGSGFVIQVADTGIGIASEEIPKALSKFGQIGSSLSGNYDGTGLGLPLAKSYVELHGGSLDLQSELDVGTTVSLRFPASRIVADDREEEIVA